MIHIPGFNIDSELFEGRHSLLFRARREIDKLPVILKFLKKEYPTAEELGRFRREFDIAFNLQNPGSIKAYQLEKFNNSLVIISEDFGGQELARILKNRELSLKEKLSLALRITDSLAYIHEQNIIHKDINPSNIVWNPETDVVKIIDFGISTELSRETRQVLNPHTLEGTLAYISPEQTGRMNRSLDYRSDLYSLGVTFYKLFSSRLPFETKDATELVHAHIARPPNLRVSSTPNYPRFSQILS